MRTLSAVLLAALLGLGTGCVVHSTPATPVAGPPPWAPAHGYRHRHAHTTLVFDSSLDCYVLPHRAGHYFHQAHFYRQHLGDWQRAETLRGPWTRLALSDLPKGLRKRAKQLHKELHKAEKRAEKLERKAEKTEEKLERKADKREEKLERQLEKEARKLEKKARQETRKLRKRAEKEARKQARDEALPASLDPEH